VPYQGNHLQNALCFQGEGKRGLIFESCKRLRSGGGDHRADRREEIMCKEEAFLEACDGQIEKHAEKRLSPRFTQGRTLK